jgi:hypothetical protein
VLCFPFLFFLLTVGQGVQKLIVISSVFLCKCIFIVCLFSLFYLFNEKRPFVMLIGGELEGKGVSASCCFGLEFGTLEYKA